MMGTIITGVAFGAALVASGMYSPYLITSQFSFEKWNMVQIFLTATACSALSLKILQHLGLKVPPPRPYSSVGLLGSSSSSSSLDGNIIGGAILGVGMSLSASCPGIVFPQLAMGVPSAPLTAAGAAIGGIFWSAVLRPRIASRKLQRRRGEMAGEEQQQGGEEKKKKKKKTQKQKQKQKQQPPRTLAELAGTGQTLTFLTYETLLVVLVAAAATRAPSAPSALHPVAGGLAIGGAQLVSLLLRGSLLGASGCYEHLGDWVVYLSRGSKGPRPAISSLVFSGAMMAGARVMMAWTRPSWALAARDDAALLMAVPPLRALVGGFLMAVGSRVAGGCASGHGISGMGLMSVSSFVSMFATFAAAIAVSRVAR
ncbi:hypothetical protein VM1G_04240 [Cytospora mali]|uniref:Uncharacterized protein n=1 Tax=Cytospora mali TaxID=578113 RepID=A0A194VWH7_CYTMA|nr:hypothetical protein VM1G_04240 [Valsa mali]